MHRPLALAVLALLVVLAVLIHWLNWRAKRNTARRLAGFRPAAEAAANWWAGVLTQVRTEVDDILADAGLTNSSPGATEYLTHALGSRDIAEVQQSAGLEAIEAFRTALIALIVTGLEASRQHYTTPLMELRGDGTTECLSTAAQVAGIAGLTVLLNRQSVMQVKPNAVRVIPGYQANWEDVPLG